MKDSLQPVDSDAAKVGHAPLWKEGMVLVALAVIAGGIWFFAEIADEVIEGDTHEFDRWILLAMRDANDQNNPWGPGWVEEAGRDFTALGGTGILFLVTAATLGGLWLTRRWYAFAVVLTAVLGGALLALGLKLGFDRPRPDLVPYGSYVYTQSFPSGHSMLAGVTYLTLGLLIARVTHDRRLRAYIVAVSVVVTLLVGISRIYLGVHWPTDVLAGWTAGAVWALVCWVAARWLHRKRQAAQASA